MDEIKSFMALLFLMTFLFSVNNMLVWRIITKLQARVEYLEDRLRGIKDE